LGLVAAAGNILFGLAIAYWFSQYTLDRSKHDGIVAELLQRKQAKRTATTGDVKGYDLAETSS
jgi:Na+/melibiose symporter-like transporter